MAKPTAVAPRERQPADRKHSVVGAIILVQRKAERAARKRLRNRDTSRWERLR